MSTSNFSSPGAYALVNGAVIQAVVTTTGSSFGGVRTLAAPKTAKLGAQVGTTSYTAITDQIVPAAKPAVYDTSDLAVQALKNGQVDGLVVDLTTPARLPPSAVEPIGAYRGGQHRDYRRRPPDGADLGRVHEQGPPAQIFDDPQQPRTREFLRSLHLN